MNLLLTVFESVAPVFALAGIGFLWVRLGQPYDVAFVTRLAVSLSVPCLIFTALMNTEVEPAALTSVFFASVAVYAAIILVTTVLLKGAGLSLRSYLAPLSFGNTGNLGLPLALFAFGDQGLDYAVVVFAVMAVLSFTFGIWVVSGGGNMLSALREPIVAATLLGAIFLAQGWQTPLVLTNTLELIGQMAIPLMLITLGVAIAGLKPGHIPLSIVLSLIKLFLCAGLAYGTAQLFDLGPLATGVLVLQVATPVAVTSYMLAHKYGADAEAVAGLVMVSTLMCVAALPLLLGLLL